MRSRSGLLLVAMMIAGVAVLPDSASAQSGRSSKARSQRLWGLSWLPTLDQALARAQRSKKPVLWLRMLGDLDGFA